MGVIAALLFMLGICSEELLAMKMSHEISIREVSENSTGIAAGQQTQLGHVGDKENNENLQGNKTSTTSQLKPRTVNDSFTINLSVSKSKHLMTKDTVTAVSMVHGSVDGLNKTNKILSDSVGSHMKPKQYANYASGDRVKLFKKYGTHLKAVVSTSKPTVTVGDRVKGLRKKRELMFRVVSRDQSGSEVSVPLSDNSGEIASTGHIFSNNDDPENVVLNYTEALTAEEVTSEESADFKHTLMYNSIEESYVAERDAQGNHIPCNAKLSVAINDSNIINGSLYSPEYGVTFPPGFFWEGVNNSYFGCICSLFPCIRKCCSKDMMYPQRGDICIPRTAGAEPFVPKYFDENTYEPVEVDEDPVVLYGIPCKSAYLLDTEYKTDENYLLPNGGLLLPHYNRTIKADEYCLETFEGRKGIAVLRCFPNDSKANSPMLLYSIGMLISVPFLLATFFVYGIIPELRNLHGQSLMCHVSSLAVAYIFLSTVQLGYKLNPTACVAFAFIIFFAFLASFFWLNVMCFDIFWTFSGIRPLRGSAKERENKKFVMYSCYAWGAPFLLLIICIILDFVPGIPADAIKPKFGHTKCWFSNDPALTAYFFGPVGTLLVCNMLFFIITAIRIFQLKQETAMLKGADSRKSDDKANTQRFKLYLKLFVVMGVTWVMEVVSYVVGGPSSTWYVPDLCNTLQGLLIFLLFVWKKNVRTLLARKFGKKSEPRGTGSQKSHAATSRSTSLSTLKDRNSTVVTDSNSIHLKPISENSSMY